ncbi:hypothetical protein [Leucobacter aridicollis]|uniref:hypothetical protein n=1 Tax=Leucobacter aridicollis TaxID=283878 RepID=UPI002102D72B|nr:hypothetical protein [Leucobacter aridicollis]UTX53297.1 hypothetical protein KI794_00565 [Leucobacter aridicollis]
MTRFADYERDFDYLHYAEESRTLLSHIPDEDVRNNMIQRHDQLVRDRVPFDEFPSRLEDLQPTGISAQEFAITAYTDGIYCNSPNRDKYDTGSDSMWGITLAWAVTDLAKYQRLQEYTRLVEERAPVSSQSAELAAVQRPEAHSISPQTHGLAM